MWAFLKELIQALFARPAYDVPPAQQPMNQEPTTTPPVAPAVKTFLPSLTDLMTAMRDFEGSPGDLNYQNNNPLNCRCSPVGYAPIYGNVLCVETKSGKFSKFPTYALGWLYAKNLLTQRIERHPEWTLLDLIGDPTEGWAPASDNNVPLAYARFIARRCKVDVNYKIMNFIA